MSPPPPQSVGVFPAGLLSLPLLRLAPSSGIGDIVEKSCMPKRRRTSFNLKQIPARGLLQFWRNTCHTCNPIAVSERRCARCTPHLR